MAEAIVFVEFFNRRRRDVYARRNYLRLHRRNLRNNFNPFGMPEQAFRDLFRLSRESARYVVDELQLGLQLVQPRRATEIPPYLKVIATLNFYASGSYQRRVGQDFTSTMSQSAVSRSVIEVTRAINNVLLPRWIIFPITQQARNAVKQRFMEANNFPGVIGCVDGTHIAIVSPTIAQQEHLYVNRKSYHSKNVQIVCDYELRILAINARHPGSHHNQFIWNGSAVPRELRARYNNGERSEWLLGDSGYTEAPWLLCPMTNQPEGSPGFNYTRAHCSTRNCVERCIGVLKARLRCCRQDRTLHYSPQVAGQIINACAVVHNIAQHYRLPEPEPYFDPIDLLPPIVPPIAAPARAAGQHIVNFYQVGLNVRDALIRNRFT